MQIAIQIFGYLAVIGGIIIGILLYYHKQTPAIWITFVTIMSLTLSLCLGWQQNVIKDASTTEQQAAVKQEKIDLTILSLFNSDFENLMKYKQEAFMLLPNGEKINFIAREYFDFESQAKFIGIYIPNNKNTFEFLKNLPCEYKKIGSTGKILAEFSSPGIQPVNTKELKFSGRVFIYHESHLFEPQKRELYALYEKQGLSPQFRGIDYLIEKQKNQKEKH